MVNNELKMVEDPSGAMELDGYRHTLKKVDWDLITGLENPCTIATSLHVCPGWHFTATIQKSPISQEMVGMVIRDPSYEKIITRANVFGMAR